MDKLSEIKALIKEIAGTSSNLLFTAKVERVEGDTCTVKLSDSLSIPFVRLKATEGVEQGLLLTPKEGSKVTLLSSSGKLDDLTVIKVDEVNSIQYKQDGLDVLIDSEDKKVCIKNEQVSLLDLMQSLSDIIKNIKVSTGTGPSGTPLPDTISQLQQFETQFQQLLK